MTAPLPSPKKPGLPRNAQAEFRRMMKWIALAGVVMVAASLWYLSLFGPLTIHMVVATTLGVFFSMLLGCGLFAIAFFSDKSGHDETVTYATRAAQAGAANPTALPPGLHAYSKTPSFTGATMPAALAADHETKPGTWGLIRVAEGKLRYRITDPRRAPMEQVLTPDTAPGIVEPAIRHNVEPLGDVRFEVEFWRQATTETAE